MIPNIARRLARGRATINWLPSKCGGHGRYSFAASSRKRPRKAPRHRQPNKDRPYPKMADPQGRKIEHAAILNLVTTNICGSDLHIYNGRFAAPAGMQMGHETSLSTVSRN
jgi:hypothetical protein